MTTTGQTKLPKPTLRQRFHNHKGHWKHKTATLPYHGWYDTPHADSQCSVCKITGEQYNTLNEKWNIFI